jgi:ElaB/YqjD/DUF883 family membrane-anchored ribosome-binding protein
MRTEQLVADYIEVHGVNPPEESVEQSKKIDQEVDELLRIARMTPYEYTKHLAKQRRQKVSAEGRDIGQRVWEIICVLIGLGLLWGYIFGGG